MESLNNWEVCVGNLGVMYCPTKLLALEEYAYYKKASKEGYGRVSGEDVVLMCDGEIVKEYIGSIGREASYSFGG
jgi:hypothetical protein